MFDDLRARRIDAALAAAALTDLRLVPVATSWRENHRWVDHDLCALVERWRGAVLDPAELTPSARAACHAAIARVARVAPVLPDPGFQTRWWITLNGREAGTLATARFVGRGGTLAVFALHVSPAHRRAGVASDALALAEQAARTVGLEGVSTELRWGEREALRFLVRRGLDRKSVV